MGDVTEHPAAAPARPPRPPRGLLKAGRRFWRDVVGTYELRPDELAVLERAARTLDDLENLDRALEAAGTLTVEGSMGQIVAHPFLAERRQHAVLLARLLRHLRLPDEPGDDRPDLSASWRARRAARERWG